MPRRRTYRSYRRYSRKGSPETGMALLVLLLGGGVLWLTIHFWFVMLGVAAIGLYVYRVRAPVRAAKREAQLNLGNLQRMNGYAFERACAAILQAQGWRVQVTRASGDYGADVVGVAPDGQRWVVQAKQWQKAVGPHAVQEVVVAKAHYGASHALVITTSQFTAAAFTLARDNGVVLWDSRTLLQLQQQRAAIATQHSHPPHTTIERWLRGIKRERHGGPT